VSRWLETPAHVTENPGDLPAGFTVRTGGDDSTAVVELLREKARFEIESDSVPARLLVAELHRRKGDLARALDEMQSLMRSLGSGEVYVCATCGRESEEYWSRCPHCFAWVPA